MKIVRLDEPVTTEADELELAVKFAARVRFERDQYVELCKRADAAVIKLMTERGRKTFATTVGDEVWKTTMVIAERVKIDEKGLQKAVGASLWNKVTNRKLDKAKLETVVANGEISADVVATHSTIETNTPYLRLTQHREQEPEEQAEGSDQPPS